MNWKGVSMETEIRDGGGPDVSNGGKHGEKWTGIRDLEEVESMDLRNNFLGQIQSEWPQIICDLSVKTFFNQVIWYTSNNVYSPIVAPFL